MCLNPGVSRTVHQNIQEHVQAKFAGMGVKLPEGVHPQYSSVDVFQTKDYTKVGTESYINHMLQTHG